MKMTILTSCTVAVFTSCLLELLTNADAQNAYGDHGIVYTAIAGKVDEEYQNIISVPSTPMEIDNTTKEYPGFNFGFVFRQPMSCDVDYHRNELYVYDYRLRGLLLLENYNSSAMKEQITITRQHYGISKEYSHIAVDWISHNVYWTDPLMNWIAMQPGGAINDITLYMVVIKDDLYLPRAIAVDPIAGYLFWSDYGARTVIERSTLTGDDRTLLIFSKLTQPNVIVADPFEKRIYWTDLQYIDSATYDGTDRRQVVRDTDVTFFDMALFKDVIITTDVFTYFYTGKNSYSRFYNKTTGKEITEKRISVSREVLYGVCMYHGENQPAKPEQELCKNEKCQDICVNEPRKATCLCREGFVLDADGKSCREQHGQHQRATIINTGSSLCLVDIRILNDQHDYAPACFYNTSGSDKISFFDINMNAREVYFTIGSKMYRVYIDKGADAKYQDSYVVTEQSYNITGMSYDYDKKRIYFAIASSPPQFWYIDVETGSPSLFLKVDNLYPRSLTVVPSQNKAYWLEDLNYLQSVDLGSPNSTNITNLALIYHPIVGTSYAKHMVHHNKWELFYVLIEGIDGHSDLLAIDYNGTVISYVATDKNIVDFALYKEYIILINKVDGKTTFRSADLGAHVPGYALTIVDEGTLTDIDEIVGVKILDARLQPEVPNPCGPSTSNGGCEHFCFTDGTAVTCKCKLGFTLHTDGKQCVSRPGGDDFILASDTTYNEIVSIPLNNPNTVVGIRTPALNRPDGVIYNHLTGEVVWTSTATAHIWAVNLNGTEERRLVEDVYGTTRVAYPDQLALDPSTGNIYYTGNLYLPDSVYRSFIAVLNRKGEFTIVHWEGQRPRDIELDPVKGLMFWSDYSDGFPAIYRGSMDGSLKRAIHNTTDLVWPNGIALDRAAERIYWTDGNLDHIQYSDYDGNNRQTFMTVENGSRLMDLELVDDYLYFTAMGKQQVTRVNKNNKNDIKLFGPQSGLGRLYGLDVYSSTATTNTPVNAQCASDNGGCTHFCLPRPGGYSCDCPLDEFLLLDNKTCSSVPLCPLSIPNGKILYNPTCIGTEGNMCQYMCEEGYRPRDTVPHITCNNDAGQGLKTDLQWDVQDPCEVVTCPDLIENGFITNCSLLAKDVCLYRCNVGFEPNMTMTHILCGTDGTWNTSEEATLCSLKTTTTTTTTEKSTEPSASMEIGIGVGVGVGVVVLIIIIVIIIVYLIRSGKLSSPVKGKTASSGTAFENPRYAGDSVQIGETNASFGYATLDEDKVAGGSSDRTYDNIVPKV